MRRLPVWAIVCVLLLVPLVTVIAFDVTGISARWGGESSDYVGYSLPLGQSLAQGKGFMLDGEFSSMAPGFPFIIAATIGLSDSFGLPFDQLFSCILALMLGFSAVVLFQLAIGLFGKISALLAALLWLAYPLTASLLLQPLSETPFVLALVLAVLSYVRAVEDASVRWAYLFAASLLLSVSMLLRPIAVALPFVFVLHLLVLRKWAFPARIKAASVLLLFVVLCLLPNLAWTSSYGQPRLLPGGNAVASIRDGLTFGVEKLSYREAVHVPEGVRSLMLRYAAEQATMQSVPEITSTVLRLAVEYPMETLQLAGMKIVRSLYGTDSGRNETLMILIQLVFLLPLVWGVYRHFRSSGIQCISESLFIIPLIFVYFWGMTFLVLSIVRYMVPAITLLFVFLPAIYSKDEQPLEAVAPYIPGQ
ncbi:MAG: glycosyltransferase family 39 protein [Bacteroidia bacterium]|nr:glycosyltransferase family 39 protein [Bacteroidia bacterium]